MSFTVRAAPGKFYAEVASNVGAPNPLSALAVYPCYWDPLIWAISYNCSYSHGSQRIDDLLGCYTGSTRDSTFKVVGPAPTTRSYDGQLDEARYGSVLTGLNLFGRILSGSGNVVMPKPGEREHCVSHANPIGNLGPSPLMEQLFTDPLEPGPFSFYAGPNWVPNNRLSAWGYNTINLKPNYLFGVGSPANPQYSVPFYSTGNDLTSPHFNSGVHMPDVLKAHKACRKESGYTWEGNYLWRYPHTTKISNLQVWEYPKGQYTLEYDMDVSEQSSHNYWHITVNIGAFLNELEPDHFFDIDTGYQYITQTSTAYVQYTANVYAAEAGWGTTVLNAISWTLGETRTVCDTSTTYYPYLLTRPAANTGTAIKPADFSGWWKDFVEPTGDIVMSHMNDIRVSAYNSTVDALNTFNDVVAADDYQTLLKFKGLSSLVPAMEDGVKLLRLVSGKELPTLRTLADAAANISLALQFQTRAQIEYVRDHLPEYVSAIEDARKLVSVQYNNYYGSHTYEFPYWVFNREGCTLTTRTKMRARLNGHSIGLEVFGLRRMGLLPTPSVLWDLTPFSFVANWFTGIGRRIRDMEALGLINLVDFQYLVHSYTIDIPLTSTDFDYLGVSASTVSGEENTPVVRWFFRDVSTKIPPPRTSIFDFTKPSPAPKWTVVGPLLWQYLT